MKPVIKKQTHYNLLLMRDDSAARTFRVHSTALKACLIILCVLVVGGAAGIYGGVHYWTKYRSLSEQHQNSERELSEIRLQLERLANLERLMAASNAPMPQTKNEEVGVPPLQSRLQNGAAEAPTNGSAAAPQPPANGSPASAQPPAPALPEGAAAPAAQTTQEARQDPPQRLAATDAVTEQPPAMPSIESSPIRVNAFSARPAGQQRLRLQYELSAAAADNQRTISGSARYIAVFADRSTHELQVQDIGVKRFSITRMKPMQTTIRLPQEQKASDIEKVQVIIELSDGTSYMDSFDANK